MGPTDRRTAIFLGKGLDLAAHWGEEALRFDLDLVDGLAEVGQPVLRVLDHRALAGLARAGMGDARLDAIEQVVSG